MSKNLIVAGTLGTALAFALSCGSTDSDESNKGGNAGTVAVGGTGGAGGAGGTGGSSTSGGSGGIDCSTVGCGAPPRCGEACGAPCGCCPCAEGEKIPLEGGFQVCQGGCYLLLAACGDNGVCIAPGASCPTDMTLTQMGCDAKGEPGSCCIPAVDAG